MKRLTFIFSLLLTFSELLQGQDSIKKKNYFPIWTYHQKNLNIYGVSIGLGTIANPTYTNSNGIKLELIGAGIIIPLIPRSPISQDEDSYLKTKEVPISERINGISLSASGTSCNCVTNGLSAGLIGQINTEVNGISGSLFGNMAERHNGIQISLFNESYSTNGIEFGLTNLASKMFGIQIGGANYGKKLKGIQIGLLNKSEDFYGLQIGLWNKNQMRKFPLINWNFKRK